MPRMTIGMSVLIGFGLYFLVRCVISGFYTIGQNERGVLTSFGRAARIEGKTTLDDPLGDLLNEEEKQRYIFPQVEVIQPGGPYFKWPWQKVYKVSIATRTINMAQDLEDPSANRNGTELEAVTKDQLNTGLTGQMRYRPSERNLYAYLFGVKRPIIHVMGYFVSILRQRIANFEAPKNHDDVTEVQGISINDLRKNVRAINEYMDKECASSAARYGVILDASLITGIDPPREVESALAAINTAHNQVSSEISLAQAHADQKIVQSRRAVEIETLKAEAEAEPLRQLAQQLAALKTSGNGVLAAYLRNVRMSLIGKADRIVMEENQ